MMEILCTSIHHSQSNSGHPEKERNQWCANNQIPNRRQRHHHYHNPLCEEDFSNREMQSNWEEPNLTARQWPKTHCKHSNLKVCSTEGKNSGNVFDWSSQSADLNPSAPPEEETGRTNYPKTNNCTQLILQVWKKHHTIRMKLFCVLIACKGDRSICSHKDMKLIYLLLFLFCTQT